MKRTFEELRIETSLKMLNEEYANFKKGETCKWSRFARNLLSDEIIKDAFIKSILTKN